MKTNSATVFSTDKSRSLYERSRALLIEGGSSPSRGPANYGEYPVFMERGVGSRLFDWTATEYIDWTLVEPKSKTTAISIDHANALLLIAVLSAA